MPIDIEKIPDAPIVVVHAQQGGADAIQEMVDAVTEITRVLDEQTEKVFLITDMRSISMTLDDIMQGASMSARGQSALLHHPNIRESIYILTDRLIKMAVKGLSSATFGQINARVFDTVEEALAYCRETLGQKKAKPEA